jgi:hypothetical protein
MKVLTKEEAADLVLYFYDRARQADVSHVDLIGRFVREMVRTVLSTQWFEEEAEEDDE